MSTIYYYVEGLPGLRHDLALLGIRVRAQRPGRSMMGNAAEEAIHAVRMVRKMVYGFVS